MFKKLKVRYSDSNASLHALQERVDEFDHEVCMLFVTLLPFELSVRLIMYQSLICSFGMPENAFVKLP